MQSYPSPGAAAAAESGPFYSSAPTQQPPQIMSTPEELQLAAQLSRGHAAMNAGPTSGLAESQDPRAHGSASMSHPYEQDGQHPPPHPSMDQMGSYAGQDTPRKRSKVSRACDECRRKKIRCDASTEGGGEELCSSCRRVGARCQFSRVPMKRGPSKGYIKELAERLNNLEGAIHAGQTVDLPGQYTSRPESPGHRGSEELSPPPGDRKRAYSSMSGEYGAALPYQTPRMSGGWSSQDREPARHLPPTTPFAPSQSSLTFREPNYGPNGLPPLSAWRAPEPRGGAVDSLAQSDHAHGPVPEYNDDMLDPYYQHIHAAFPILCVTPARQWTKLQGCQHQMREAFLDALYACTKSFSTTPTVYENLCLERALRGVATMQFEPATSRSLAVNQVYLQTLLLLAVAVENGDPHGQVRGGPSSSLLLGTAVGLAYSLKLYRHQAVDEHSERDPDSEESLSKRLWWTLISMDRWHAIGYGTPLLIPDGSVVVRPEAQSLMGEEFYHFTRLSVVMGHVSAIIAAPTDLPPLAVPAHPLLSTLLRGELERVRESLPAHIFPSSAAPLVHLTYWFLRIHVSLHSIDDDPTDLMVATRSLVTQINHLMTPTTVMPVAHHFMALAALSLFELLKYKETQDEAEEGLNLLLGDYTPTSRWDPLIRETLFRKREASGAGESAASAPPGDSAHALTASQGLQRLADLATATEQGRAEATAGAEKGKEATKEWKALLHTPSTPPFRYFQGLREMTRTGYLDVLAEGTR